MMPKAHPPRTSRTKIDAAPLQVGELLPNVISAKMVKKTTATPSLSSDSPSISRPEQQGLKERDGHAETIKAGVSQPAGQQTRHRSAGERQRQHQPPLLAQTRPTDVDTAAKQHETEHALQQRVIQVERMRELAQQIDRAGRNEDFQYPQPQRRQHCQQ